MSQGRNRGGWVFFITLLIVNGALYGAITYLKHYNPAYWVLVSDDYNKILLARQFPDHLEADGVGFSEVGRVELVGDPSMLNPRRAEVFVDTVTGRRLMVYFGSAEMYQYANDLSKRLDRPLSVTNYEAELKVRDKPLESADGIGPAGEGGVPQLPSSR